MENKNNLPAVKKENWFIKVIDFFKKIFANNKNQEEKQVQNYNVNKFNNKETKADFAKSLKLHNNTDNSIQQLQIQWENGNITEEELTQDERDKINALYDKQIEDLKTAINMKKRELQDYKNRILALKEKVEANNA